MRALLKTTTAIGLILLAQVALTRPVLAGGLTEPLVEQEPLVSAAPLTLPASTVWPGAYAGAHFGCAWLNGDEIESENGPCDLVLGGHVGYNFATGGNLIWGVEADLSLVEHEFSGVATGGNLMSTGLGGTVRLRLGYATSDDLMLYTTGGFAFTNAEMQGAGSNTHVGWTVGVGAEWSLTQTLAGRVEVRHTEYGSQDYTGAGGTFDVGFGSTSLLLGLSHRF